MKYVIKDTASDSKPLNYYAGRNDSGEALWTGVNGAKRYSFFCALFVLLDLWTRGRKHWKLELEKVK